MNFSMIVAADEKRGIARDGDLPWHLPGDLAHYKNYTSRTADPNKQNAVIMGRTTWDTLPPKVQPLPGRYNVVLSRSIEEQVNEKWRVCRNLDDALVKARANKSVEHIYITGGGQIYTEALEYPECQTIIYTRILKDYGCDTFFPEFEDRFEFDELFDKRTENDTTYRIEIWHRK